MEIINDVNWLVQMVMVGMFGWCGYLFTVREWLDRRLVRLGRKSYDGNGLRRWQRLCDEVC